MHSIDANVKRRGSAAVRVAFITSVLLLIAAVTGVAKDKSLQSAGRLYTSDDHVFQFRYPAWMVLTHSPENYDANCQGSLVCVQSPPDYYTGYDFAGAGFWVGIPFQQMDAEPARPVLTKSDCLEFRTYSQPVSTVAINGVKFATLSRGGAAAGTTTDFRLFRTFHNGKCYEVGIALSMISCGYYKDDYESGRIKHFGKADEKRVRAILKSIVGSFRFLQ